MWSICNHSNLQQQFTNCTFCNSHIHNNCSQTNAAALQIQIPVCTTCINGTQPNRYIENCFVCNTNEGELLVCNQCICLGHKTYVNKLNIPITDDTLLCPWCTPFIPHTHQPPGRHTGSNINDEEGNDQQANNDQHLPTTTQKAQHGKHSPHPKYHPLNSTKETMPKHQPNQSKPRHISTEG